MIVHADPGREISATRTFRASVSTVLEMWSQPEHLTNWWGPEGFSTTTHEMNFKPGGVWRFTMHGPDGTEYPNLIRYLQTGPDCIEYLHGGESELVDFHVIVDLLPMDDQTQMVFRMVFPSAEERIRVAQEFGAVEGLTGTLDRLEALLLAQQ